MPLSYYELCDIVERDVITDVELEHINSSSIDVRLGRWLVTEQHPHEHFPRPISVAKREVFQSHKWDLIEQGPYILEPGEFVLGQTYEKFNLPHDICAEFKLKSSGARTGLENALATWCDQGWHGSVLTLELKNFLRFHPIQLEEGMFIGQMVFHRTLPVPHEKNYATRGRYNNDDIAQPVKL